MTLKRALKPWPLLSLSLSALLLFGCAARTVPYQKAPAVKDAVTITIDLCPSSQPYEAKLFSALAALGRQRGKPLPVTIFVSGRWLEKHPAELQLIKKAYLDITWGNHSYSHPVERDFLNDPRIDFNYEVRHNLEVMKKSGLKPSRYFRFPGLRHDRHRLAELAKMGYVSVDANAWLGKMHWWHRLTGGRIKEGSIILIHGNGNERPGIVNEFISWLKHNKRYRIAPLADFMPAAASPPGTPAAIRR